MNSCRRVFALIGGILAAALVLAACGSSGTISTDGRAGNKVDPYLSSAVNVRLPDGRVLRCLVSAMSHGYSAYDCDWTHPLPKGAANAKSVSVRYIKVNGNTLECIMSPAAYGYDVYDCDWAKPVTD